LNLRFIARVEMDFVVKQQRGRINGVHISQWSHAKNVLIKNMTRGMRMVTRKGRKVNEEECI